MAAKLSMVMLLIIAISGCTGQQSGFLLYEEPSFSLQHPSDWNHSVTGAGNFFTGAGDFPPTMRVSGYDGTVDSAAERARQLQSGLKDYRQISEENLTIDGKHAFRHVYSWTDAGRGISFTQMQVWTDGFLLTATSLTEDYGRYEPLFERMIGSFRIR